MSLVEFMVLMIVQSGLVITAFYYGHYCGYEGCITHRKKRGKK